MKTDFATVFARLRHILKHHADCYTVRHDTKEHYGLEAATGPATLKAWGGKTKSPTIPVAWVQVGKAYVSFHLMGVYGNPKLLDVCSNELKAHMQGKSCFNFKTVDEPLFQELARLTADSLAGMNKAGFTAAPDK